MSDPWLQEFWRIFGLTLSMSSVGFLMGHTFLFLFVACLIYLGWHLHHLYRLDRWFIKKKYELPDASGIWGEVFYRFHRLQQRNRKRKRKLAAILKRFQHSANAMPDAVVVLSPQHEIEWFNKSACHLLGFKLRQDAGQSISNLIRYPVFYNFLISGDRSGSVKIVSPVDAHIMLRIHIVPYAGNRYLLIARDITELHRLEQIRRDFVANVSHELRTPLTVIAGFLETMREEIEDEWTKQWQRPLLLMSQQTTRMRCIVDDLLLLSRLESEIVTGTAELVKVPDMLKAICEEARMLSDDKQHQLTLEADKSLIMYGYSKELHSAFSNLVFNAVRYTPIQGQITVRWYADEQGIHLQVQDNGEGIAPEHLPRLTERFYRVDVGRSRNQGGTGLGLAIVKHVLIRHQGQLRIESTVDVGSTFWCDFPLKLMNELPMKAHDGE